MRICCSSGTIVIETEMPGIFNILDTNFDLYELDLTESYHFLDMQSTNMEVWLLIKSATDGQKYLL